MIVRAQGGILPNTKDVFQYQIKGTDLQYVPRN